MEEEIRHTSRKIHPLCLVKTPKGAGWVFGVGFVQKKRTALRTLISGPSENREDHMVATAGANAP